MNLYMIVEGDKTELQVYPEWLKLLSPHIHRVYTPHEAVNDNYYLFSGGGIPSIYHHIANAAEDIVALENKGIHYDYLLVCMDSEGQSVNDVEERVYSVLEERGIKIKIIASTQEQSESTIKSRSDKMKRSDSQEKCGW